jgi:hypothetical protein
MLPGLQIFVFHVKYIYYKDITSQRYERKRQLFNKSEEWRKLANFYIVHRSRHTQLSQGLTARRKNGKKLAKCDNIADPRTGGKQNAENILIFWQRR